MSVDVGMSLKGVSRVVTATTYEHLALWREFHEARGIPWEQLPGGFWIQIGSLDRRPVCISFSFDLIAGGKVAFLEAISQVVDHTMVDGWIAANLPGVEKTDAMNFAPRVVDGGAP